MNQDERNLDLLGVFHYVIGGFTALFACFPIIHVVLGIAMLRGDMDGTNPPPAVIGWMFTVMGSVFILFGWALAILILLTGRRMRKRSSHTFCFVVACVECILMPFGTVLGVLTIIHLNKDSVRQLFASPR